MSAQAYTWGEDGPGRARNRPPGTTVGTVVVGPWPAIEEIRQEYEHAVVIDRARLEAAAPVLAVPDRQVFGGSWRFSRGPIPEWIWSTAAAAVMTLLATGVVVALWRLAMVWQGQIP
ncbi:hypothetical protein [Acidipropionibacterium virtanenii]|uniref:Uncharacterized protein n=1 Tax=Acidipropionibacterium virtanenii TaxID=2057246 RepID=A0A344UUL0_9ACTN|nr:hypothetical protein [Acidipropionibacterium virtanenii]AXE38958.1 hypothetical protein JS278_01799 [Acidipropionibacterium virtanenii]